MFIQGYVPFALIQDNTGLVMVESTVVLAEACVVASLKLTFSLTQRDFCPCLAGVLHSHKPPAHKSPPQGSFPRELKGRQCTFRDIYPEGRGSLWFTSGKGMG